MRLSSVRDRNLSLWQSAVGEMSNGLARRNPKLAMGVRKAASLHAVAAANGITLAPPAHSRALIAKKLAGADPEVLAYVSQLTFDIARAHQHGDKPGEDAALEKLKEFIRKYSTLDIIGWLQCVWYYIEYYVSAQRQPPYRDWGQQIPPNIDFGIIDFKLPSVAKILILGDWGTGMTDHVGLLRQALRKFKPDVIIHLGDIYYSGINNECEQNVLQVMDDLVHKLGIKRPPFFTIPGNHEYYSGGVGYFNMIDRINNGVAGCLQRASYFCLRSADSAWQFLGMDTGYNDRDPIDNKSPGLQKSEAQWHHDKLKKFIGTTILLSHHQLFSANLTLTNNGNTPYLNTDLYQSFEPYFDRVAAWFWGHEHNFVMFKEGQSGLRKGRLIGCSAYEETEAENPYENKFPHNVAYAPNMKQLDLSPYQDGAGQYYNHAMALLEVSPAKIDVSYYQFPSWGTVFKPPGTPIPKLLVKETILPTPHGRSSR